MRVCWNRQTGTFEGRVSMTYEFKSRHSHHLKNLTNGFIKRFVRFSFYAFGSLIFMLFFILVLLGCGYPALFCFCRDFLLFFIRNSYGYSYIFSRIVSAPFSRGIGGCTPKSQPISAVIGTFVAHKVPAC